MNFGGAGEKHWGWQSWGCPQPILVTKASPEEKGSEGHCGRKDPKGKGQMETRQLGQAQIWGGSWLVAPSRASLFAFGHRGFQPQSQSGEKQFQVVCFPESPVVPDPERGF